MPATAGRRRQAVQSFTTGPFRGVQNTDQPYDDAPDKLVDAVNCYIPDPIGGSEIAARQGFAVVNPSSPLAPDGQGVFTHIDISGNAYNFVASGGKLYRYDDALTVATDVTPAGSPISSASTHVYFTSFIGQLIISDGVNRPWVATNLSATPVTRTAINMDAGASAWAAFGQPEVYGGSLFFILDNVAGTQSRLDIIWSVPADPLTGYQQANYDFRWTLEQTGSGPLYALKATNVALYYFRDGSIGSIQGIPGPDLQSTATHDAVSENVGTLQSATVQLFGNNIFFCDVNGRPWMLPIQGEPEPIWLQLRSVVDSSTSGYPSSTAQVATAAILPSLNLYVAAIWSPVAGLAEAPLEMQVFDARNGIYLGRWNLQGGTSINAMGIVNNTSGRGALLIVGSLLPGINTPGGYVWVQNVLTPNGITLTTEDGVDLTTEDDVLLTTENATPSWLDNGLLPPISITTQRLGYTSDGAVNVDSATLITNNTAPVQVSMMTSAVAPAVQGTPVRNLSQDGTYRLVVGADRVQGRGVQLTASPQDASSQWRLYSISVIAQTSKVTPEEP